MQFRKKITNLAVEFGKFSIGSFYILLNLKQYILIKRIYGNDLKNQRESELVDKIEGINIDQTNENRIKIMNNNNSNNSRKGLPKSVELCLGIFMVFVYIGMGTMFYLCKFDLNGHTTTSKVIGAIMIIYGIWRGIRLFRNNSAND